MVRILLPFMAGTGVCIILSSTSEISLLIWIGLLLFTTASGLIPFRNQRFITHWIFGISVSLLLFVTGYNSVILHKEIMKSDHFANNMTSGTFIAEVAEPLQEKDHSYKTILRIKALKKGNRIIAAEGHILTYFAKNSVKNTPEEGSLIAFSADLQQISPPQNPGAFDYRKYMANNNVYHQVYLKEASWKLLKNPDGFNIYRTAHKISNKFVNTLSNNGLKGKEFAVASALILGQGDMLDNETRQAYSGSGVMHILCVSGLHVGVIFIIISFFLGFMKKEGPQLYLKTFLILITIWAYALLTGMSPSVMRSAIMFTFISFGNASRRYTHIINSLSVSALLLLLIDPFMLVKIGFQLSYLAILGIVFINKPIADLLNPKNKIAAKIWSLVAVSVAAQIATAPLTMLYFHQFPAYFIPANIIAIPLSFLAIYSGIGVLVFSAIPVISNFFGLITNYLLFALNYSVSFIEKLPYAVLRITSIFTTEMILLYLILISILLMFFLKRKALIFIPLGLTLLFSLNFSYTEIMRQRQDKIIFYSTGKQSAIGFIDGRQQTLLADSVFLKDQVASRFQLDGTKSKYGIIASNTFALDTITTSYPKLQKDLNTLQIYGNTFMFHNKRIAVIDRIPVLKGDFSALKVHYLVIRHNPQLKVSDLQRLFQAECIIIDGSNSFYKTAKWMAEFKKAGLNAYSIKDSGAYIAEL
jgi:competence protein ComEC